MRSGRGTGAIRCRPHLIRADPPFPIRPCAGVAGRSGKGYASSPQMQTRDPPSQPKALIRTFRDLQDERIADIEMLTALARTGLPGGLDWSDLLRSSRIMIISEAGAGKTFECRSCQKALWKANEPAFFLELAELARSPLKDMLTAAEERRFDEWLAAENEVATFLLDSIDELKLTQGSFEQALKRLAKALEGRLDRARIIITTRPVPFDQELVRLHLPAPDRRPVGGLAESFADVAMRNSSKKADEGKRWISVALMPLSDDQIHTMASLQGVADPDEMIADLRTRDAMDFARRPQDLVELCADWRDHHRIRTHWEQVGNNVDVKLRPRRDRDRPELAELSPSRAREGAARLALAMLLTRRLTIRYAAEADRGGTPGTSLDPTVILIKWTMPEIRTLLERPLFGFASYGRVRFHHRSVLEYLAAERLDAMIASGVPIRAIKRVLLAETAQGDEVVRPGMRAVAGWLAGRRDAIFDAVLVREPEVLLEHGDPQSLDVGHRARALRAYVDHHGDGGWRGLSTPHMQVHRFASVDLCPLVGDLWRRGIGNPEVRNLLLKLIGAARMTDLADIPYEAALIAGAENRERVEAVDTLILLQDPRLAQIGKDLATGSRCWPDRLAETMAMRLFPQWLDVDGLLRLLRRLPDRPTSVADLGWHLANLARAAPLGPQQLDRLRSGLTDLVLEGVVWRSEWPHVSVGRPRLVPALAEACLRQIEAGVDTEEMLASSAVAIRFEGSDESYGKSVARLRTAVSKSPPSARGVMFWSDDAFTQSLKPSEDASERLSEVARALRPRLSDDEGWVLAALGDRARPEVERAMMIELAVREFHDEASYADHARRLLGLVDDSPKLQDIVEMHARPRTVDQATLDWIQEEEQRILENAERQKANRRTWLDFWSKLADEPESLFASDKASGTAWTLWEVMCRAPDGEMGTGWDRRFIEEHFGRIVADRLRTALMAAWRMERPTLPHERPEEQRGQTLRAWRLGLAGIHAESEDPEWARKLSPAEAQTAARYAPLEFNALPPWIEGVIDFHPHVVADVLGDLLDRDLNAVAASPHWHSSMLQNVEYAAVSVQSAFTSQLRAWFAECHARNRPAEYSVAVGERLDRVARLLLRTGSTSDRAMVAAAAREGVLDPDEAIARIWLPLLLQLDPPAGTDALENRIARAEDRDAAALEWFGRLFGERGRGDCVNPRGDAFDAATLLRLIRLAYEHVRREDDAEHEGSFSPDLRDEAERGRDAVLTALLHAGGPDGWAAKLTLAADPLFEHLRNRILALARELAAEEVDGATLSPADAAGFDSTGERALLTRDDMAGALNDGLDDVEELLLQDVSPREAWCSLGQERVLRREIARVLRDRPGRAYTVDQEGVTADEKETDIRLRSTTSDQQAVIELKMGDKRRSAADLRAALETQLLGKYMAADRCRAGCLLISLSRNRHWNHPASGEGMDFGALIDWLNAEAQNLVDQLGGTVRITVRGLDLRPRLATERVAPVRPIVDRS